GRGRRRRPGIPLSQIQNWKPYQYIAIKTRLSQHVSRDEWQFYPYSMLPSNDRVSGTGHRRGWILKIGAKMFQNSVPITERHAGTTNGAASARNSCPTRTHESRVEIEARRPAPCTPGLPEPRMAQLLVPGFRRLHANAGVRSRSGDAHSTRGSRANRHNVRRDGTLALSSVTRSGR